MIESMTGFGRGQVQEAGQDVTVEARTVNNRYCEVSVHLPRDLMTYETQIQKQVKAGIARGKVHIRINVEQAGSNQPTLQLDEVAAQTYTQLLKQLRTLAGINTPLSLQDFAPYTDKLFTESEVEPETVWPLVQTALTQALDALIAMRRQEGKALKKDLVNQLATIETELIKVEARAPERIEEARCRLQERLDALFEDERMDENRLMLEIAILADRLDISEECVRLRSHLALFREAMADPNAVGRKLNFLVQEMNREINTIGSKSNDAGIAHHAVQMKEALEKTREQVQNVQ